MTPPRQGMRFRLTTIAYLFALLASGISAMGSWGVLPALLVFGVWAFVFRKAAHALVLAVLLIIVIGLVLPVVVSRATPMAYRASCQNNLKMLALGALNYESAKGAYPEASLKNATGAPLHSWRMAILPFMEQLALYNACNMSLPWDSPANATVARSGIEMYQCPAERNADPRLTSYFAVVDRRTIWPPDRPMQIREVTDGTSQTILFLEAPGKQVPWARPEDLSFDEAVTLLSTRPKSNEAAHNHAAGYFYKPYPAVGVAYADGSVRHLPLPLPRETAVALLTAAGDEPVDTSQLERLVPRELDYGKCYAFALFILLSLLPAYRLAGKSGKEGNSQPNAA